MVLGPTLTSCLQQYRVTFLSEFCNLSIVLQQCTIKPFGNDRNSDQSQQDDKNQECDYGYVVSLDNKGYYG